MSVTYGEKQHSNIVLVEDSSQTLQNSQEKPKLKTNRLRAVIFINILCVCVVTTATIFKEINKQGVTASEFLLWRNFICWFLIWFILVPNKKNPLKDTKGQLGWIVTRVTCGLTGFALLYFSATLIPIFLLNILWQTSPLWTSILGMVINNEKMLPIEYVAIVLCFSGVCAISLSKQDDSSANSQNLLLGIFCAFTMSWLYSCNCVIQRKIGDVFFAVTVWWQFTLGTIAGLLYLSIQWMITGTFCEIHSAQTYGLLVLCCLIEFCALCSQTIAFSSDSSGFVSILQYMTIVYAFFVDQFYFQAPITGIDLIGALTILTVTISTAVYKFRRQSVLDKKEQKLKDDDFQQVKVVE